MRSLLPTLSLVAAAAANFLHWDAVENPIVKSFLWTMPFPSDGEDPMGFDVECVAQADFKALQFKLSELWVHYPAGLRPWAPAIEEFLRHRDYPGHWDGVDHGGHEGAKREYIFMEWRDVPHYVRDWIEEQQRHGKDEHNRWLFAVMEKPKGEDEQVSTTLRPPPTATPPPGVSSPSESSSAAAAVTEAPSVNDDGVVEAPYHKVADEDKVLFFAAGALYQILPLWVAHGSSCEGKSIHSAIY